MQKSNVCIALADKTLGDAAFDLLATASSSLITLVNGERLLNIGGSIVTRIALRIIGRRRKEKLPNF
jgi:hypothetical protein